MPLNSSDTIQYPVKHSDFTPVVVCLKHYYRKIG